MSPLAGSRCAPSAPQARGTNMPIRPLDKAASDRHVPPRCRSAPGRAAAEISGWTTIVTLRHPPRDPHVTALEALGWIMAEPRRAQRFLDLTGLSAEDLRASASAPSTHRAVLDFLCAHEPDLLAAADALGIAPGEFADARHRLGR